MKKQLLQTFMSKYCFKEHSNSYLESVIWEVENNVMTVRATPSDRSMLIKSSLKSDEFNIFNGYSLGVNRTTQFMKLLNTLDDDIKLNFITNHDVAFALEMYDDNTKVRYAFGDTKVIFKVPKKANIPEIFEVSFDIDTEFINRFIKSKSAISDIDIFSIEIDDEGCIITFGNTDVNSNTISFRVPNVRYNDKFERLKFDGFYLKQILNENKDLDGVIEISSKGLMGITFKSKDLITEYYLLKV